MNDDFQDRLKRKGWPCACVKRDRKGRMTHIRLNAPEVERCRRCGATRDAAERLGRTGGSAAS
jgi:hypothetical protein